MIFLRSAVFNFAFYLNLVLFQLVGVPVLFMPHRYAVKLFKLWGRSSNWLLSTICNIQIEFRGLEHIPTGPLLVVGKHQSFWETFAVPTLLEDPCMVQKMELFYIPGFGWPYSYKLSMIGVKRSGGAKSLRNLILRAKQEVATGRQIIILPEGTRQPIGATPDYKPGAAALYAALNLPCLPFGLNAGQFWPKRKFLRKPGKLILEFGKVIPAGLPRKTFEAQMQNEVESITNRLCRL